MEVIGYCGIRTPTEVPIPGIVVGDADAILAPVAALLPEQTHLVAEIVGRGNRRRDYQDKPRIYAAAGIPTFPGLAGRLVPEGNVRRATAVIEGGGSAS